MTTFATRTGNAGVGLVSLGDRSPFGGTTNVIPSLSALEAEGVVCPSLESLERRYESADRAWMQEWLADEVDPTVPDAP